MITSRSLTMSVLAFICLLFFAPQTVDAQFFKRKKNKAKTENTEKKSDKSISDITKDAEKFDGLFTMYRDTVTGETWMEVSAEAMNKEFIYFSQVEDGVLQTGNFRGSYRSSKIITFHKHYDRIEIHQENTSYYFDPESPLSRAEGANINVPIIASLEIKATEGNDSMFLISGDALFLSEKIAMIKPPSFPGSKSALGKLSINKTKIVAFNNYPENLEVIVDYVYDNSNPSVNAQALTDARYITVGYRHAIIQMPEEGFTPRKDDARIGFFMTQVNDMTSTELAPWKDMIHRWRLDKKDPTAELSEPIKPITWWIENTTPYEFRDYIKTGVEKWNLAFEKIGFKNAVVVKIQPDDATWDAGDIRYNVLRWTSSPTIPFSGYGPSFVNPRTGEILGADVMLEFAGMTRRLWKSETFKTGGEYSEENVSPENFSPEKTSREKTAEMMNRCDAGEMMVSNAMFTLAAMKTLSFTDEEHEEFTRQTLHRLSLHEVGHTLGLSHNMHASTMLTPEELKDADKVAENGMCNSVMEYPAVNFTLNPEDMTLFYDDSPGPYDYWVIEYAYSSGLENTEDEDLRLEEILSKSDSPLLQFGNDADDMRGVGRGINPDVNIYDLSNDPVAYASERCDLVNHLLPQIVDKHSGSGSSFEEVRSAYYSLTGEYAIQLRVMTRQIAGIRYNRSGPKNIGAEKPYTPVSLKDQKAALSALAKYAFAPNAFNAASGTYAYLQAQRRGFGFFGNGEDPKIHSRVLSSQKAALDHLLHRNVLNRLTDVSLYGGEYDVAEYLGDLTDDIFKEDLRTAVNTFRQGLQTTYTESLISALDPEKKYDGISRGVILSELNRIEKLERTASSPNALTSAHRFHIQFLINQAWEH